MRVTSDRLNAWVSVLVGDTDCVEEVRDRMTLRLMEKFREADLEKSKEIRNIQDNMQLFFDELYSIADAAKLTINDTEEVNE